MGGGGGGSQGIGTQPAHAVFHPGQLKTRSFWNLFLWYGDHLKWTSKVCFRPYLRRFSPYLGIRSGGGGGGGGLPRDWYTTCSCSFSPWAAQKSKFLKLVFLILWSPKMTIQGMFLGRIYVVFHPIWGLGRVGGGGGGSQGIGTQPAHAVFHPGQLKTRSFRNLFLWYGNHLKWTSKVCFTPDLRRFSPYLGIESGVGGGGGSQGIGTQPAHAVFHPGQLKTRSFWNLFFWYCDHLKWPSKVCKACFRPYLSRFSPYLGIRSRGGGGELPRDRCTTCLCSFSHWAAQNSKFLKLVFMIRWSPKMNIQGMF